MYHESAWACSWNMCSLSTRSSCWFKPPGGTGVVQPGAGLSEVEDNLNKHPIRDGRCRRQLSAHGWATWELSCWWWNRWGSRPNLPDWTLQWPGTHMSDFPDRLTEMARYYMKPRTLVEVEVKDAEEQQVRGTVMKRTWFRSSAQDHSWIVSLGVYETSPPKNRISRTPSHTLMPLPITPRMQGLLLPRPQVPWS